MNDDPQNTVSPKTIEQVYQPMNRRTFLKGAAASLVGVAGLMAALKPLLELEKGEISLENLLQRHYRELKPADLQRIMAGMAAKTEKEHGIRPSLRDLKPLAGVEFGYALNLTRCIGCRKCAHACLQENNQSRSDPDDIEMSYIRVLEMKKGAINLETSSLYYDSATVPQKDKYYMPVQCHQCRESPCTKVCPVQATWQESDGIVVVDYNWCIGCRYCMAACPYDARRFNYQKPTLQSAAINPNQSYLSNRLRPKGVVEKCTFCLHRTREGKYPACLEVCPTGARVFGNLRDPDSEINYILNHKRVYVLKEDVGTLPRFYYFFDKMRDYLTFLWRVWRLSFQGSGKFYVWMSVLTVVTLFGVHAWARQLVDGLATTGMTNQVSWGAYIANFTFLVGVAAAAVMLVIPAYIYKREHMHEVVLFGELMAIAVIVMCLLFVTVDLGHPERFHHMIPPFGVLNFPGSILSWDVIVLNGYLVINLHIAGYLLYCRYRRRPPTRLFYIPFVFLSIAWAVSIHTVTAFLYVGLAGRSYWHNPLVPSRFLASAFVAGPALMVLTFQIIRRVTRYWIGDEPIFTLRMLMTVAMIINMFLLGCELFTEFYYPTQHGAAAHYLYFGLHGHDGLVPWIWTAITLDVVGLLLLATPFSRKITGLNIACVACFVGIWIEKGMGLIIPGFVPTPLGQVVEYLPTLNETLVCLGIWAFGALMYSWMLHVAIPIMNGSLRESPEINPAITQST